MTRGWRRGLGTLLTVGLLSGCGGSAPTAAEPEAPTGPSIVVTPEMGHPHPGEEAPDFELPDAQGETLRLSSLRGAPVVLTFVASWCPYSTAAQPHLVELAHAYEDRGVRVIAVDLEESDEGYQRYLARADMPFPVLRDRLGESVVDYVPEGAQPAITDRWKVLVSAYLLVDADGVIRFFTLVDMASFDAELVHLRRAIDEVLAEEGR